MPEPELWTPIPDTHEIIERVNMTHQLVAYGKARADTSVSEQSFMYYDAHRDVIDTTRYSDDVVTPGVTLRSAEPGLLPDHIRVFGRNPETMNTDAILLVAMREAGVEVPASGGNWRQRMQLLRPATTGGFEARLDSPHTSLFIRVLDEFLRSAGVEYRPNNASLIVRPEWLRPSA